LNRQGELLIGGSLSQRAPVCNGRIKRSFTSLDARRNRDEPIELSRGLRPLRRLKRSPLAFTGETRATEGSKGKSQGPAKADVSNLDLQPGKSPL
jgi:hypothetical protein